MRALQRRPGLRESGALQVTSSRATRTVLALTASAVLLGCPLLKSKKNADDNDDPPITNAPTVKIGGTGAKNEANVLRYATETKLLDEPATIGKDAKVREFPQSGKEIVTIGAGTPVTKLAKYFSTGVLVIFTDPSTSDGSKLMGWIEPAALGAAPAVTPVTPVTPVNTGPKPAVVVVDAGTKPAAADAGGGGGVAVVDAGGGGGGGGGSIPLLLAQPGAGNKCPAGMTLMGPFCRRPCASQAQCPANTFCTAVTGGRACTATK